MGSALRIVIAGSSGFLGQHLTRTLADRGHSVLRLLRPRNAAPGPLPVWDPAQGLLDPGLLGDADVVVNLCGENVAGKRWSPDRKRVLHDSRIRPTTLLATTMATMPRPPGALISMSAIGIYGPHGNESVDEQTGAGDDFLAGLARAWEEAATPASAAGIRVVHPRLAGVLSASDGILARLLPPFRMGVGGRVGTGKQILSWIALDDALAALAFLIEDPRLHGPVNLAAPGAVSNEEFARTLASILRRPSIVPLPESAVSLMFGEMGRTLLLSGARVVPRRLLDSGFTFAYPDLRPALQHLLSKGHEPAGERSPA
jgi:uncharacterized protein (TIGR01777 family)